LKGVADRNAAEALERSLVIPPSAARTLGYRIDWETGGLLTPGNKVVVAALVGDSIAIIDSSNTLSRVKLEDGTRVWQLPFGGEVDTPHGIIRVTNTEFDRLYVTTEGQLVVIDAANGTQVDKQRLTHIANTASALAGRFMVYGSRGGQFVWHEYVVGHMWRAHALDGAIREPPVLIDNVIIAVSSTGGVMAVEAPTARRLWTKELLSGVTAKPTGANGFVFVAGEDQYLWAFELETGRTIWKYFNDAPLRTDPVLIGDRLYQRIPSEGLVCFDAFVTDQPGGRKRWTNPTVKGEVLTQKGLWTLVWGPESRTLSALDGSGAVAHTISLPHVRRLVASREVDGDLYGASDDGRAIRLVPQ
jgi:outer membrane protein assembly factor BamB